MDAVWLYLESADTPMHFAMLMTFLPPEKSPRTFIDRLAKLLIETSDVQSPWNLRLPRGPLGRYQPILQVAAAPQLEHHVRRAAVRAPAGHHELLPLVANGHVTPFQLNRLVWEGH